MSKLTIPAPVVGEKVTAAEPKVGTDITTIETWANGEIDSTNIKAEGITEADLDAATKTLLNSKSFAALTLVKKNEAAFTAASGELVLMEKEASVLTLPEPTAGRIIGAYCASTITSIKVKPTKVATKVFGDFLGSGGAAEITLTGSQHVILQAEGSNWLILAGEPKREAAYTTHGLVTAGEDQTPSATRPVMVVATVTSESAQKSTVTFPVSPGQKWRWAKLLHTAEFKVEGNFVGSASPSASNEIESVNVMYLIG